MTVCTFNPILLLLPPIVIPLIIIYLINKFSLKNERKIVKYIFYVILFLFLSAFTFIGFWLFDIWLFCGAHSALP